MALKIITPAAAALTLEQLRRHCKRHDGVDCRDDCHLIPSPAGPKESHDPRSTDPSSANTRA